MLRVRANSSSSTSAACTAISPPTSNAWSSTARILDAGEPQAAFRRFENWLRYEEGRVVYLATRGVGRVREINLTLDTIKVYFGLIGGLSFKPDEAARMLEPLPPGHFLIETVDRQQRTQGACKIRRSRTAAPAVHGS